ncbi:MAG: ATP-binding protein [Chloroflexi bacterium]|nr:ATP-binding protein [Chloroflexota bacterium]MBP8057141.1 ATP-binding protein [Chloroflexota bacterium]
MSQQQSLTVPGRYDQIRVICEFVAAAAKTLPFDEDDIFHIELACDEACTNIIEHAYGGENLGPIHITWAVENKAFIITLADKGEAFNPATVSVPPTPEEVPGLNELDNLKIGGLGLHFMKKMMDKVLFSFDEHTGNQLIMVKHIKGDV